MNRIVRVARPFRASDAVCLAHRILLGLTPLLTLKCGHTFVESKLIQHFECPYYNYRARWMSCEDMPTDPTEEIVDKKVIRTAKLPRG